MGKFTAEKEFWRHKLKEWTWSDWGKEILVARGFLNFCRRILLNENSKVAFTFSSHLSGPLFVRSRRVSQQHEHSLVTPNDTPNDISEPWTVALLSNLAGECRRLSSALLRLWPRIEALLGDGSWCWWLGQGGWISHIRLFFGPTIPTLVNSSCKLTLTISLHTPFYLI